MCYAIFRVFIIDFESWLTWIWLNLSALRSDMPTFMVAKIYNFSFSTNLMTEGCYFNQSSDMRDMSDNKLVLISEFRIFKGK